jgi:hypothetical protein
MRTKTLLLTAVLSAAGIASSLGQVFSQNIVGYVNRALPPGFSLIANPLNVVAGNTLNNILPSAPIGTILYKYDPATGTFNSSTFIADWNPNLTLAPGEGAFINLAGATTVTFVGEVMTGPLSNPIPAGFSIRSSQVPQAIKLEDMGFPAAIGDIVYFFRGGTYESSTYIAAFVPDAIPGVGEAFFVNKGAAATWTRTFTVN